MKDDMNNMNIVDSRTFCASHAMMLRTVQMKFK